MSLDLLARVYPRRHLFSRLDGILSLFVIYLLESRYAPSTIQGHIGRVQRCRRISRQYELDFMSADAHTVRVLLARADATPGQALALYSTLRLFYGFLVANRWRPDDPTWQVARPDPRHGALRVLDGSA